jgi:EpsI family protein
MTTTSLPRLAMRADVRNALLVLVVMLLACVLAFAMTPRKKMADVQERIDLNAAIPTQFGDWSVDTTQVPVNPSPDQAATLASIYQQTVSRTYVNKQGQRVMLSMAYGSAQTNELRAHRQEVCYTAQGFKISQLTHGLIPVAGRQIRATRMVARVGRRVEPVTYWFTMGDNVVLSILDRQITQLKYSLSGVIPDGYLVRLSSLGSVPEEEFKLQLRFGDDLFAVLPDRLKRKLVGGV